MHARQGARAGSGDARRGGRNAVAHHSTPLHNYHTQPCKYAFLTAEVCLQLLIRIYQVYNYVVDGQCYLPRYLPGSFQPRLA